MTDRRTPSLDKETAQARVRAYWDGRPCDSDLSRLDRNSRAYFLEIERRRYALQPHIPMLLDGIDWRGKRVLEIGAGVATDARRIIAARGIYTGINVDPGSTALASQALRAFSLPGNVVQRDARALGYPDASFDIVYAFGVIHHIPDAEKAVAEIYRVLRPGGELLLMLYNRGSINYVAEIMLLRKLGLRLLSLPFAIRLLQLCGLPRDKLERHRALHRSRGRVSDDEWLSRNTNGPDNPYACVYDAAEAAALLHRFSIESQEIHFFDYRHWGLLGRVAPRALCRAIGRKWGWHRVIRARKPGDRDAG